MPDLFGNYLPKSLKSDLGWQIFLKKGYLKG